MQSLYYSSSLISIEIVSYICLALLVVIFFIVLKINAKLSNLSHTSQPSNRANSKSNNSGEPEPNIEVEPGTPFEEFLNEDPSRRSLSKKEQFAAYRDWRSQKGLNWK